MLCAGRQPVDEDVAVANAAFVRHIVEIERLVFVEHGPDHFARSGRDAAVYDGNFVFQRGFLRVLRVKLHVGLRIETHDLDLAAKQPARAVDFVDGEVEHVVHWLAGGFETAGKIVHAGNHNGLIGRSCAADHSRREHRRCRCRLQECSARRVHGSNPPCGAKEIEQKPCHYWSFWRYTGPPTIAVQISRSV